MKNFLIYIFLFMSPWACFAITGRNIDNRYYVTDEMWKQHPYNKFVRLQRYMNGVDLGGCTAQYISHNLILSAGHCVVDKRGKYKIKNYKKQTIPVELIYNACGNKKVCVDEHNYLEGNDWAIWRINKEKYFNDDFFDIAVPMSNIRVINAGYGTLRILTDKEIQELKKMLQNMNKSQALDGVYDKLSAAMVRKGMKGLGWDNEKLKASICNLDSSYSGYRGVLETDCYTWGGNSGGAVVSETDKFLYGIISAGPYTFDNQFSLVTSSKQFQKTVQDLIAKNSTGSFNTINFDDTLLDFNEEISFDDLPEKAQIYAITKDMTFEDESSSEISFDDLPEKAQIYTITKDMTFEDESSSEISFDDLPEKAQIYAITKDMTFEDGDIAEVIDIFETDIQKLTDDVRKGLADVSNMNDSGVLNLLGNIVDLKAKQEKLKELQKAYDEAKANEQSMANRMLTAATVAATGIGGMELAQGLAEQKADKEAESDMTAYISTMRCKYGNKSVKAGNEEIELPGGNDETMMKLRDEYFALSANLKERKEALGMKPGIESETILDKSQMGLYDDESVGITSGNYSSLYRAKILESESDKTQIDESKETSKNRVIGGGTAAGVGVVGGAVGDYLINGKSSKQKDKK